MSVVVADDVPWAAVERVAGGAGKLIREVSYVDEYRGWRVSEWHRSLTLGVVLRPAEATLTAEETGVIRNHVLAALSQELGAHLR
jgi:phenylalanyl-tRNA synthetase beta subunit